MADKITSVIAREEKGNIQITFTIPFELVKKAQEEAIVEMAKDIEIPGFRRGMAPLAKAAEKIPQNRLVEHSLGHLLPQALTQSVEENKLKLAIYPKFELISAKEGEAWQIRGLTCELPEVILEDYKKIVPGEIRAASLKKELAREEKEGVVIKALIDNVKVEIPQILIEEEADSRLASLLSRLERLGLALEAYLASMNKKAEDLRAEYAVQAKQAIAIDLILSKIAVDQNMKIEPKEIDEAIKISGSSDTSSDRKRLIESILKRRKALDFLINLD
ncbi:MAG: Trigger factor [Candidatus Woesebacteria bacterium GW2011_GWA2_40_7]|uniref:Trigger factor n=3 Tax=Candidatus Woeseibacteriota TaxID=1752722 RepID=A0A0G0UV87_9BACT|nr:MAG: Trigger factor [Candidatus Woesebacteria bacterium GW2011_GWB1_39_10]KKR74264.1 MAG: Trigger factor [Candidatus Woesebacteria bacterium GW2011_GWA2_40_7]KKR92639.1 MAG: Trigger factor [Candidatus Woesebacteria bacterium GW2011_GWA1_41_13b]